MIKLLKKYWYLFTICLLIDAFMIVTSTVKTNNSIIMPGGLNEVQSLIEVDSTYKQNGSINTIYVFSMEKATIMQSFLAGKDANNMVSITNSTFDLSYEEQNLSGNIQKNQSIEACLICAYETAHQNYPEITLDYRFKGFIVYTKQKRQKKIEIGDIIYQVMQDGKLIDGNDINALVTAINSLKKGDTLYLERNGSNLVYQLTEDFDYKEKMNCIYAYQKFEINAENSYPSFSLHRSNTQGPSGGLLQTLSVYSQITGIDYTNGLKIAGTGMIYASGKVGEIGGIKQKVITALKNNVDIFICPASQYDDAYEAWTSKRNHERMKLIKASTFDELIARLGELYAS